MINLSLDELKLVAKNRNIRDYENKSEEDLIKILSEPKPRISITKKKLKEIKKDFSELRHKFSKEEIDKFRKSFYNIKNHKNLYASEIREAEKNLVELEESLQSIKSFDDDYNDDKKLSNIRRLYDVSKPKKTDDSFAGRRNDYIEYISEGDYYENLSPEEYLDLIRPYLIDLINDHKTSGEWKIWLVMLNRCISSINFEETRFIYSASDNIEIFMGSDTDEIIDRLFNTILQRFQEARETSSERGSEFIHENVDLLYYYFHKIDMRRGKSYIKSTKWLKNKNATMNPKNEDDNNCLQYAVPAALDHKNVGRDLQRIPKIKPFITKYNWEWIEFPAGLKDWKKFEQNNETIVLNILYVPYNTEQICCAYKSKYNNEHKNQVILLMITDGEKWHYLALKSEPMLYNGKLCNRPVESLSRLLRGKTSNHHGDLLLFELF